MSALVRARPGTTLPAERRRAEQLWHSIRDQLLATCTTSAQVERATAHVRAVDRAWDAQTRRLLRRDDLVARQRVVVAVDPSLLGVLSAGIGSSQDLSLVGRASGCWATVGVVAAEQPDILVLDLDGDTVTTGIPLLRTLSPRTRLLLCSASDQVHLSGLRLDVDATAQHSAPGQLAEALRALSL